MSHGHALRRELHILENKIQRVSGELDRLNRQKKNISSKLLLVSMDKALEKMDSIPGEEEESHDEQMRRRG